MNVESSGEVPIRNEVDIVTARRVVRDVAVQGGFGTTEVTRMVTAAAELARNIFKYAGEGVMRWRRIENGSRSGVELVFADHGPGIADVNLALQEGYTTGGGPGLGLPGAKRLVDELDIQTAIGKGTTITLKKWRAN